MSFYLSICRLNDGLPLAESMEDALSESVSNKMTELKLIQRKLDWNSPKQLSIESKDVSYHYVVVRNVSFMALTEHNFPKVEVFAFLSEISNLFFSEVSEESVQMANKPYAFVQFDMSIQKCKRKYTHSRANDGPSNRLDKLNKQVIDVQSIMTKNVNDLLERGNRLNDIGDLASDLKYSSEKYLKEAKYVNLMELYRKYAPFVYVFLVIIVFVIIRVYIF